MLDVNALRNDLHAVAAALAKRGVALDAARFEALERERKRIQTRTQELQAKLLRVLETGHVVRVGGEQELPIDVRVIAATNRVPEEAVAAGKLRQDLLYRLSVFRIGLPSVR